jgi:dipeptidyl aminopeptidase/acylaminoacyl peptidase
MTDEKKIKMIADSFIVFLAGIMLFAYLTQITIQAAEEMQLQEAKDVEFKSEYDGTMQKYMICLPKDFDSSKTYDMLMLFHGHGSDRQQYITDPRDGCKGARDAAVKLGVILVSPDYRAPASWMGPAAEADTVQLIGDLKKKYKVGKVFLHGGSMGGTAVLTFTALHPELVDGVSSQVGVANLLEYDVNYVGIQDAIKESFGGKKDETPEQYKKRNPDEYKKRSAEFHPEKFTMPVTIMVGGKDDICPPQSALRLAEAIKKHNRDVLLIHRENLGHDSSYEDTVKAIEFIVETVRKKVSAQKE